MEEQATSEVRAVSAVVVYRYPVYRDLIIRVLERADVSIAGALDVRDLSAAALRSLRPEVVVIYDPDANVVLRDVAMAALLDPAGSGVRRVICAGSDNEMVVLNRIVVPNPSVESLVGCVKGLAGDLDPPACVGSEAPEGQVGRPEQRSAGNGGS